MNHEVLKSFREAVNQSKLTQRQKLIARLSLVNPRIREALGEYITVLSNAQADRSIIEIILEHLPEIIALIELILKLLDD